MLKLYFAPTTRSIRIKWLLEELELEHETILKAFKRDGDRGFAQDTPSGKFPHFEDGHNTLSESGAIVQYVLETYGNGRLEPAVGSAERAKYLQWLHFSEGTAASPINSLVWMSVYREDGDKHGALTRPLQESLRKILDEVESAVADNDFIVGNEFSAADIMIGFTMLSAKFLNLLTSDHPNTGAYLDRLLSRPALRAAIGYGRSADSK